MNTNKTRARCGYGAQHGGGTGVAFAWEAQLLNTPTPTASTRA